MKLKIFGAVLFTAITAAVGRNYSQSQNEMQLSDLASANGETSGNHCFNTWYQEDILGGTGAAFLAKVCGSCIYKYLNSASNPGTC